MLPVTHKEQAEFASAFGNRLVPHQEIDADGSPNRVNHSTDSHSILASDVFLRKYSESRWRR